MSAPRPYEADLLAGAEEIVDTFARKHEKKHHEARLQLLEAVASRLGGFRLEKFQSQFHVLPITPASKLLNTAECVVERLKRLPIHPSLALSALSRETLNDSSRRTTGAYHTDFRLARSLAQMAAQKIESSTKVIDPACGAGMLLVALTIEACGPDRKNISRWLAESVHAADLSPLSLRGCLLSLASLTNDLSALSAMQSKWVVGDSLLVPETIWRALAPKGFDVVIGNPPWEKVKLSRHEYLKAQGHTRHYGAEVEGINQKLFAREKTDLANYARRLTELYPYLADGEPDLYIAFTELFASLCTAAGTLAALVPAGLIRSKGTQAVRCRLFESFDRLTISVIENRARFFNIDSRFKFLAVVCRKENPNEPRTHTITLLHERGTDTGLEQLGSAQINCNSLRAVRPDMSVPEVRSGGEWRLFQKLFAVGVRWDEGCWGWKPVLCREVDMTREYSRFRAGADRAGLQVIEGRMVQQHRFGAKGYSSGSGRRAVWKNFAFGNAQLAAQFRIRIEDVPLVARDRINQLRGGFCDITGQTNERSMMAALIPPGVVCGNKVPTILFPEDPSEDRLLVWCSVMNSFVFDWMLRRIVTTTVNYFLLLSLPMPKIAKDGLPWQRIVPAARKLRALDQEGSSGSDKALLDAARLRAQIDAEVAVAYGLSLNDLKTVIADFPLLDRGQPRLDDETSSTVTRDLLMATAAKRMREDPEPWTLRAERALDLGARAYVPSEFASVAKTMKKRSYYAG